MYELYGQSRRAQGTVPVARAAGREEKDGRADSLARHLAKTPADLAEAFADLQDQRTVRLESVRKSILESLELVADGRLEGPEGIDI